MSPYAAAFLIGTSVRIADRVGLEAFQASGKAPALQPDQLACAGLTTVVRDVGYLYGGDPLYSLLDVPGLWREECLRAV